MAIMLPLGVMTQQVVINTDEQESRRLEFGEDLEATFDTTGTDRITGFSTGDNIGQTVDCELVWGDGQTTVITNRFQDMSHTYGGNQVYYARIVGQHGWVNLFNYPGYCPELVEVTQLGQVYTSLDHSFSTCTNLTKFGNNQHDWTGWHGYDPAGSGTDCVGMPAMLDGCTGLLTADLRGFSAFHGCSMSAMFRDCTSLHTVLWPPVTDMRSNVQFYQVPHLAEMFKNCSALDTMDLSGWLGTDEIYYVQGMFYNCTSLTFGANIPLEDWNPIGMRNLTDFLFGVTLSTAQYDAILLAWDEIPTFPTTTGTNAHFGNSKYTGGGAVAAARTSLQTKLQVTIIDGGTA
jgi:hypothetical protein